ncbi:SDR family oxidoreductase [Maribacter algarum]|uniref:SDR family oxidoreductase n=1 Tax=Maribacter algarum (ex Zhang et al. 2020) TaxID=2578118 RepID=A0A5S3PR25_9FLAO|nr:SDR family oxidoreductase [Maribacter algarum]TMM57144.1 SDR family oxidoreductase [Maribacter algarum]
MLNNSENKVALITGAASGLGFAIAQKLTESGVKLALLDIDNEQLSKVKSLLHGENEVYPADVTAEQEVKSVIEAVQNRFGTIHILINSAGIVGKTNIKSHDAATENIKKVMDVNFMGSFLTSKYCLPLMLEQDYGRILHIASIAGKEGNAGMLAYSASKAAVIAMAKVQGKEYAETGITINALAPAVIKTAMVEQMPNEQVKYMTDKIPKKRCGTLDEFASMAAFIVSDENSFSTGFTFDLSGGRATY